METMTLRTTDSELISRNGETVEITGRITEANEEFDAEVLPMIRVRFEDGYETALWPDELVDA